MSSLARIALLLASSAGLWAQGVITTIAGTDLFFPPVTAFPAAQISFSQESYTSLAVDEAGTSVYLASLRLCQVFRISTSGVADTVAGNGICALGGDSGDGGPATRAGVYPLGIALDKAGNLYINEGSRIRRVTPAGIISTLRLSGPIQSSPSGGNSMVADAAGNLFIIDGSNRFIRRISPSGVVTLVAGNGQAGDCVTGAAAAAMPFSPRSLAIDPDGNLFVNMTTSFTVCRVAPDGRVTRLSAALRSESGLAVTRNGDLLAGNPFDGVVYRVTPSGTIRIAVGTDQKQGSTGDGGPADRATLCPATLAAGPDDAIFVWDRCGERLRRVNPAGVIDALAGGAQSAGSGESAAAAAIGAPNNVTADSLGNIYIGTDARVLRVSPSGALTAVAGTGENRTAGVATNLDGARALSATLGISDLAVTPRDELLILNNRSQILRLTSDGLLRVVAGDGFGPPSGDNGPALAARIFPTEAIAVAPDGSVYLAQGEEHRVRRIRPDGIIVPFAGTGTAGASGLGGPALSAQLFNPFAIAADRSGNVYIGEIGAPRFGSTSNYRMRVVGPDGVLRARAGLPQFASLAGDGNGNVYVTLSNSQVIRVSPSGVITPFAGGSNPGGLGDGLLATGARLESASDVAVDSSGNVLIADSQSQRVRAVLAQPPTFTVNSTGLAFSAPSGGQPTRAQTIAVSSSIQGLEFDIAVPPSAAWCRVSIAAGQTPRLVEIRVNPADLPPGTYEAILTIRAPLANPPTVQLRVIATIGPPIPPALDTFQKNLSFTVPRSAPVRTQALVISNSGGGSLTFTAAASTQTGSWLAASPARGTVSAAAPALVMVTADPRGLATGTYSGTVTLTGSAGAPVTVPVILTVSRLETAVSLSQAGLSYIAVAGGGRLPPQDIAVLNLGTGRMPWSASFTPLTGGNWLQLSTTEGVSDSSSSAVPSIDAFVDQSGLDPGRYFGQISVTAPGAANSPQVATVVLDVVRPEESPGAIIRPAELVFGQNSAGISPTSSSDILIYNPSPAAVTFTALRSPELYSGNFDFLAVAPLSATVQPDRPLRMTMQPRVLQNQAGSVNLQFSDGFVRSVRVKLAAPSTVRTAGAHSADGCTPTSLAPAFLSIGQGSTLAAGAPSAVVAHVKDNCGDAMIGFGSATVFFSNGDAPIALVPLNDGRWHGTWQARSGGIAKVNIRMEVEDPARGLRGSTEATSDLRASTEPPLLSTAGVVSAAQGVSFQPIAPGGMITIYGERLSEFLETATATPLPTRLGNAELLIAGRRLPVVFANATQLNAIVQSDLEPNTQHQLIVRRGNTYSLPVPVNVGPAQPGVFTSDGRRAIALVYRGAEQFLSSPSNPVRSGDVVVIYAAGLGPVSPAVTTGAATPASPLSGVIGAVTARIGALQVPVDFAGLVPGFVALFQVNLRIPAAVPTGDDVPLVIETLGQRSPASFLTVR